MLTLWNKDYTACLAALPEAKTATLKERINGDKTLTVVIPAAARAAPEIKEGRLIKAEGQLYRIEKTSFAHRGGKTVTVTAPHVSFDLSREMIENIETDADDSTLDGITATAALSQVLDGSAFSAGACEIADTHLDYLDLLQVSRMDGLKQIVELWGGELEFDNFTVNLRARIGTDKHFPIREGRNIKEVEVTSDLSSTVTRLHIRGYDGANIEDINDGKDYLDSDLLTAYGAIREGYADFDDEDEPQALKTLGLERLAELDKPEITVKVSLLPLKGTIAWKWYGELERFSLGDGAVFHHSGISADIALRMEERTYDVLRGENTQVTLGSAKQTLAFTLAGMNGTVETVKRITNAQGNLRSERLEGTLNALKTLLYASAGYANPTVNSKSGLLFENTQVGAGFGALYLGPGVFAIANEKNADGSWDWRTFGTGAGFTADEITAGLLSADRIDVDALAANAAFITSLTTSLISSPLGESLNLTSNSSITAIVGDVASLSFRVEVSASKSILTGDSDSIVNPKKKITRIKARAYFMEAGTATIGVLAGSTIFSGTVYADTMDFYASGTAAVTTVNTAADVDVTFSEPVDVDDDYLYIALWNSAGGARWMNASINTEVVSEVQDSTRNYYMQRYSSTERVYVRMGDSYSAYGKSAALELYTLENPTEQSITELDGRVTALEATAATTNPLNVLRPDGGFCNIFKSITCIGDSLTRGVMEYTVDDVTLFPYYDDYSYPTFMRRALGCTVNNLSFGGATAIRWLAWANTNNYFADKKADAYIIALGTNDLDSSTGNITGDIADINTTDPTLTDATTDLGAYGKIIQNIYAEVPRAKIFMVTIPKTRNYAPWNAVVNAKYKALAELLGCYVIDLETYGVQTDDVADFKAVYYNGGHLNALGYYNLAVRYMSYIDWIIRNNFADFKQTAFIQGYPSSGNE